MSRSGRLLAVLAVWCFWGASTVLALSGTIEDQSAKPIVGARACYVLGGTDGICVLTDKRGFFELPTSIVDRIRISAVGFIPRTVAAVQQSVPIALEPAGGLWLRLVDEDGGSIDDGEIYLILPSGARKGPFPVNAKGVRIRTLAVEKYRIVVRAPGYVLEKAVSTSVEAGKETEVDVTLAAVAGS